MAARGVEVSYEIIGLLDECGPAIARNLRRERPHPFHPLMLE